MQYHFSLQISDTDIGFDVEGIHEAISSWLFQDLSLNC